MQVLKNGAWLGTSLSPAFQGPVTAYIHGVNGSEEGPFLVNGIFPSYASAIEALEAVDAGSWPGLIADISDPNAF